MIASENGLPHHQATEVSRLKRQRNWITFAMLLVAVAIVLSLASFFRLVAVLVPANICLLVFAMSLLLFLGLAAWLDQKLRKINLIEIGREIKETYPKLERE